MRQSEEAMTTPQIEHQIAAPSTAAEAAREPKAGQEPDAAVIPAPAASRRPRLAVATGPVSAAMRPVSAVTRSGVAIARRGTSGLVARLPDTLKATRAGAAGAVGALQTLPDPTLRSLAATSVGLGVGLYCSRAGRLAIVAGMVPALLMGAAIAVRPLEPSLPPKAAG
jgi:hypothetical protein